MKHIITIAEICSLSKFDVSCHFHFMNVLFFIHSADNGHLGCFYLLSITNNATINIHVQASMWKYVLLSLKFISRSGIAEKYNNSMFNHLRSC